MNVSYTYAARRSVKSVADYVSDTVTRYNRDGSSDALGRLVELLASRGELSAKEVDSMVSTYPPLAAIRKTYSLPQTNHHEPTHLSAS